LALADEEASHEQFLGVAATVLIATLSGFAAVYTEGVLKRGGSTIQKQEHTLAYMQIQMALASLLIIGAFALVQDFSVIVERGLWHGFNVAALVAVVSSALGGLIVSAVLKYADSVLKGYATALSVILTGILSMLFFGTTVDSLFVLAVAFVACSVIMYNQKR